MNEDTLNFNEPTNNVGITLDDIFFSDDNANTQVPPVINDEEEFEEVTTETTVTKVEPQSIEEIIFDDEDEDPNLDTSTTTQDDSKYYTLVDGIRTLLATRLESLGEDHTKYKIDEMDEEALSAFSTNLDNYILEKKYEQAKQVNPNINKLLTFIENDGDPKALVKLFKEQEDLQNIDGSTEDGKVKKIEAYYKNVLNWDSEKTSKKVDRLRTSNMIDDEYSDIEDEYNKHLENKQNSLIEKQKEEASKKARILQARQEAFSSKLIESNLSKQAKDSLLNTAVGSGIIKGTQEKISILDYKIAAMQADPEKYLKLVQFIDNPDLYDSVIVQNLQNQKTEKVLKKAFTEVTTKKPSAIPTKQEKQNNTSFDFNL